MLSAEQILVIGAVATALTFVLRLVATWFGFSLGRIAVNILLFVVSLALGLLWSDVVIPPFSGNPAEFIAALLQVVTPVVGMASLIYNLLYEKVVVPVAEIFSN